MSAAAALIEPPPATRPSPKADILIDESVTIPGYVVDLASFHRWAESAEFPQTGRYCFLNGLIWVDLSMEQLFTHNQVKAAASSTLLPMVTTAESGYVFVDGVRFSNEEADLSSEPDLLYASFAAVEAGRVRFIRGRRGGHVRVEGSPEMALEIVSDSSVQKDTRLLRRLYWLAGVAEFWLIDVRGDAVEFSILRHGPKGYTTAKKHAGGWVRSQVFDRSFRLTRQTDRLGNPNFTLDVRD